MWRKIGIGTAVVAAGVIAFAAWSSSSSAQTPPATTSTATQPPAAAANADMDHWAARIQGRPESLDAGSTRGWYFWHDDNGLHLVTTTPSDRVHYFTAVLTSTGTFRDIDKMRLENVDDVKVSDNGHRLVVKFHTHDGIDGVNFHLAGGDAVRLHLDQGGQTIDPSNIFLGRFSVHPDHNPFTVRRQEG